MVLFRTIDKETKAVDFLISNRHNKIAAKIFKKSITSIYIPNKSNIDKSASNKSGIESINADLRRDK